MYAGMDGHALASAKPEVGLQEGLDHEIAAKAPSKLQ